MSDQGEAKKTNFPLRVAAPRGRKEKEQSGKSVIVLLLFFRSSFLERESNNIVVAASQRHIFHALVRAVEEKSPLPVSEYIFSRGHFSRARLLFSFEGAILFPRRRRRDNKVGCQ